MADSDDDEPKSLRTLARGFRQRTLKTARLATRVGLKAVKRQLGSGRPLDAVDPEETEADLASTHKLVDELGALKGLMMKFGQIASYMPGALPPKAQRVLSKLQAETIAMEWDTVRRVIESELGAGVDDLFEEFSREPFAAASIGQVHRARFEGRDVAVKIQYPGIEEVLTEDLRSAKLIGRLATLGMAIDGKGVIDEMRDRIMEECDYALEARSQDAFRRLFAPMDGARVPTVVGERSTQRVLTSSLDAGSAFQKFNDTASQEAKNRAGLVIFSTCFRSIFAHCVYNADPHPGNYLFSPDGDVTFLDFGCVRHFDPAMIDVWRRVAKATLADDFPTFRNNYPDLGFVPDPGKFDWEYQWAMMKYLYRPFITTKPFRYTQAYVRESYGLMLFDNPNRFRTAMPQAWVFLNRLQWGLNSILAFLGADALFCDAYRAALDAPQRAHADQRPPQRPLVIASGFVGTIAFMRLALTTLALGISLGLTGCDRGASTRSPGDDSLHIPRMGGSDFHGSEGQRPVEEKRILPRTSPRTLQDALQKEIEVAEHIVELWWASRHIHDEAADSRLPLVFAELRTQSRSMDAREPYTEALRFALCSLGDGHLRLVDEPGVTRTYFSGLHFDRAGEDIVVSNRSVGNAKGAGPKPQPGDKLVAVGGKPTEEWLDRLCLAPGSTKQHRHAVALASLRQQTRFEHEQPTPKGLTLQRESGETYNIDVSWHALRDETTPPCVQARIVDKKKKIGVLRVRSFYCLDSEGQLSDLTFVQQLNKAAKDLAKVKTLVVDLRGNLGGTEWSAKRVLGMLRGDKVVWTRQRTRHPYAANPPLANVEHHVGADEPTLTDKPLWVLVDSACADSCELLAGALAGGESVTLIGRQTAGSVGTSMLFRLPYSGLRIAVPVTEHALPGTDLTIEGRGIVPDIEVVRARSDISAGADADLEVALDRIHALGKKKR